MSQIIIADQVYIPKGEINLARLRAGYERHIYNEKACAKCDNKPDRFNDICSTCPAYKGFVKSWRKTLIKGKKYYCVPKGNAALIQKRLKIDIHGDGVRDMRIDRKARFPLTFTGKLFDGTQVINRIKQADQQGVVKEYMRHEGGLIEARPRTGKTVMAVYTICKRKRRVIVVAHERELLKQFLRTLRKFTNLRELEKQHGTKIAGIIQNPKDWDEGWDVVLCTYQKFIHPKRGKERINKYVRRNFGYVIVDECFPKDTKIATPSGERNIQDLQEGDAVWSYDHSTNQKVPAVVTHPMITSPMKRMVRIVHEHGYLITTEDHPIWSETRQDYVPAGSLTADDEILLDREPV